MVPEDSPPVLQVENLSVTYRAGRGELVAVRDVSLTIGRGECFGLVGESGCGKSSVAWALVGFLGPNGVVSGGHIKFLGQELAGKSGRDMGQIRGGQIAMVYQDPMQALNPAMRIGDQLTETLIVHQALSHREARRHCVEMLDRVHMPDPTAVMRRYVHQLSGGQQQRVVLAMALLNRPSLLILDEPTTALDVTVEAVVLDLIDELRHTFDAAILFISHNLAVVARTCDRVAIMYAGELVEQGATRDLFKQPRHPYAQGLLGCLPTLGDRKSSNSLSPIPGRLPALGECEEGCRFAPRCEFVEPRCRDERPLLRQLEHHWVRCHLAEQIRPPTRSPKMAVPVAARQENLPILAAEKLKAYYGGARGLFDHFLARSHPRYVRAVDGVSFAVPQGKTLGIVGESGCGKSTLVKALIGLESTHGGKAQFKSFDLTQDLAKRDMSLIRDVQMVFQNPDSTLNPSHTVGYQIARALQRFRSVAPDRIHDRVIELLTAVQLDGSYGERFPGQLSGGEKQRVGIARAFASRPDLVLCDEPISSLDVSVQAAILNLLHQIQIRDRTTMILIAHDIRAVLYFCDLVAVMYLGQIMELGPAEAIATPPFHPYTQALLSAAPIADSDRQSKTVRLAGSIPNPSNPPSGCPFHTRCPRRTLLADAGKICQTQVPPWRQVTEDHQIFCHLPLETLSEYEAF